MIIRNTDTLYVTFIIPVTGPNYLNLQDSVRYLDHLNNECYLSPEDAKEYRFEHKGKLIRMISCVNTLSLDPGRPQQLFLQLIIDGPLKLFKHYIMTYNGSSSGSRPYYVLQAGNEKKEYYDDKYFKNQLPIVINTCPELIKMIQDKVYLKKDIEEIVTYYNIKCRSN